MKKKIKKTLVANRGEIAVRVIKTCKELGIGTVAIYSEIDRESPHVRQADEAYLVGPAPATESYLNQSKIVEIAKKSQTDAIHPGYGFLSENPSFVELLERNRITFIGPNAASIRLMGDKTAARRLAQSIGIPIVPGTTAPVSSEDEAAAVATQLGYPILLKAAGGGGGKGMRLVQSESELSSAFRGSQSEARSAFADDRVYVEKYIERPRHIEVQVLADMHGNVVHIGERECSIQRRHQKVVEESPSVFINESIRDNITQAAVQLIKASGYVNAGTIEFIFDQEKHFYFLEMNTRLQVEHPVTELRTGLDLVREQINIAAGNPIPFTQKDIHFRGHAIECRIYAEDPENNFFPSIGTILHLKAPSGLGIREDRGIDEGNEITTYYDPLISKIIAWGITRDDAIRRMRNALDTYEIFGLHHNVPFCSWVLQHELFREGRFNTNFIQTYYSPEKLALPSDDVLRAAATAAVLLEQRQHVPAILNLDGQTRSKWGAKRNEYMR